jgi:GntR family transcriptional regulator / MocR family aminotransferase
MYIGTTSKTLAPSLRLAWLIAPEPWIEQLTTGKLLLDDFSPTIEQLAFARLIERGHYQRHIRKTRAVYRARRDTLTAALTECLPEVDLSGVAAGLSVTLSLPPPTDDRAIEQQALAAGIRLEALSRYVIHARDNRGLVMGYGRMHQTAIPQAINELRQVLKPSL